MKIIKKKYKDLMVVLARFANKISKGKLTPNMVTSTSLILHLPVGWLIINQHLVYAAIALIIAASLDSLDGALARLQKKTSDFGIWFDACSDRLKEVIVFGGLAYYLADTDQNPGLVGLCILALGIAILISYIKAKGEALLANRSEKITNTQLNRLLGGGLLSYEWRVVIIALTLISQQFLAGLLICALGGLVTLLQRAIKFQAKLIIKGK